MGWGPEEGPRVEPRVEPGVESESERRGTVRLDCPGPYTHRNHRTRGKSRDRSWGRVRLGEYNLGFLFQVPGNPRLRRTTPTCPDGIPLATPKGDSDLRPEHPFDPRDSRPREEQGLRRSSQTTLSRRRTETPVPSGPPRLRRDLCPVSTRQRELNRGRRRKYRRTSSRPLAASRTFVSSDHPSLPGVPDPGQRHRRNPEVPDLVTFSTDHTPIPGRVPLPVGPRGTPVSSVVVRGRGVSTHPTGGLPSIPTGRWENPDPAWGKSRQGP